MKQVPSLRGTVCLLLVLFLSLSATTSAHWYPGDPAKWVQKPDASSNGIDVAMTADRATRRR